MAEPVVDVEQAELGAGMGSFPAGDDPGAVGPVVVDQVGELDDPGAVADGAVGLHRRHPVFFLGQQQGVSGSLVDGEPAENRTPRSRQPSMKSWVAPAESVRTSISTSSVDTGSWARARSRVSR